MNSNAIVKATSILKVFNGADPVRFSSDLQKWANGLRLASHLSFLIDFLHSAYSPPRFDYTLQSQHSLAIEINCFIAFKWQLLEAEEDSPSKFFSFKSIAQRNW